MLGLSHRKLFEIPRIAFAFAATQTFTGCGGTAAVTVDSDATTVQPADSGSSNPAPDGSGSADAAPEDAGTVLAPRNSACTPTSQQTGALVNTKHGRLDGTLVYVLPIGGPSKCNGDDSHVHLQVEVDDLVYDVAVDIGASGDEVGMFAETLAFPGGPWAEGWHGADSLAYPTLGLKSTAFPTASPTDIANEVESLLQSTSKISIFCTGYTPQDNGCHDVHYEDGSGDDGAIVLDPTAPSSLVLFFRFQGQTF
jgi:hypothetical protein